MPTKSWQDLLNDAGDGGGTYDPLPDGDYDFIVKEAEVKTASTGRTMYAVKTAVQGGPHNGRFVWHNFVVTPENPTALGWFFKNMNVLGLNAEYFKTDPADHQVAAALVGRAFRGQVAVRKWQGQDRNEIKAFFPAGGAGLGGPAPTVAAAPPPHAAPPPVAQPAPPPPPAAAPAPPPVQQAPAPAPVAETSAQQVQAAPVAPPPPPPPAAAAPPPPPPAPAAAPEPAMAGAAAGDAPPPPPPF